LPTIRIDGQPVDVPEGATVLDAARALGIDIPTLCHAPGLRAETSCFVCVVKVEGKRGLVPSCATLAAEGMVVTSESDEVRGSRRAALELLLSDHTGDCVAPCTGACPAHLEIADFIRHLRDGRPAESAEVVRRRLALPASLGRVCPAYCERVCRRAKREGEEAVAIRSLHGYVAETDLATESSQPKMPALGEKRVAIVGAGPAGLSAAWYLRLKGHACTVLDSRPEPGGMFRYGIPAYRLPRDILASEVEFIRRAGVTFRMSWRLGHDGSLDNLRDQFDAVLLAVGATVDKELACVETKQAMPARAWLAQTAAGEQAELAGRVVVIGDHETAADAAGLATRLGADQVACLWTIAEEKTSKWALARLAEAEADGATIRFGVEPIRVADADEGRVRVTLRGEEGERHLEADTVLIAAGRAVDRAFVESLGLATTPRGLKADRRTLETSRPGVFAAGEAVSGPTHGVQAVAAGRRAAESIDRYLTGRADEAPAKPFNSRLGALSDEERAIQFRDTDPAPRVDAGPLRDGPARIEAARCLQCDCRKKDACRLRNEAGRYGARQSHFGGERRRFDREVTHPDIVYEPGKCIQCGLCVQVAEGAGEALGLAMIERGFRVQPAVPFDEGWADGLRETAMRCAEVCPTGAIAPRQV